MAGRTGARAFTSLDEALADGGFDAVDLMLPHHLHEDAAVRCFAAGKHVLLEKPMANDVAACARILAAAGRAGTVFQVAENTQYWPEVLTAKRLLDEGAIGEVSPRARASRSRRCRSSTAVAQPVAARQRDRRRRHRARHGLALDPPAAHVARRGRRGGGRARAAVAGDAGRVAGARAAALPLGRGVVARRADEGGAVRARADVPPHRRRRRDHDRAPGARRAVDGRAPRRHAGGRARAATSSRTTAQFADFEAAVLDGRAARGGGRSSRSASCAPRSRSTARRRRGAGRRCGTEPRPLRLLGHARAGDRRHERHRPRASRARSRTRVRACTVTGRKAAAARLRRRPVRPRLRDRSTSQDAPAVAALGARSRRARRAGQQRRREPARRSERVRARRLRAVGEHQPDRRLSHGGRVPRRARAERARRRRERAARRLDGVVLRARPRCRATAPPRRASCR